MNEDLHRIKVSDNYYSLQGEGNTIGRPTVFILLSGCNLLCGGKGTDKDGKLHKGATWRCDTIEKWTQGKTMPVEKLATVIVQKYKRHFRKGAQLVITGGEPMLQQKQIKFFLPELAKRLDTILPRVEIETNCTVELDPEADMFITQYNVSPKLSNSGNTKQKRLNAIALKQLVMRANMGAAIFKFVVQDMLHIREAEKEFIDRYHIPPESVYLMPGCRTRQRLNELSPTIATHALEMGYNFSTRLQIQIQNEKKED